MEIDLHILREMSNSANGWNFSASEIMNQIKNLHHKRVRN